LHTKIALNLKKDKDQKGAIEASTRAYEIMGQYAGKNDV
jgi:hypothetical protein